MGEIYIGWWEAAVFGPNDRRAIDTLSLEVRATAAKVDATDARVSALAAKQMVVDTRMDAHDKEFQQFRRDMDARNEQSRDFEDETREHRVNLQRQIDRLFIKIIGGVAAVMTAISALFHFWH